MMRVKGKWKMKVKDEKMRQKKKNATVSGGEQMLNRTGLLTYIHFTLGLNLIAHRKVSQAELQAVFYMETNHTGSTVGCDVTTCAILREQLCGDEAGFL